MARRGRKPLWTRSLQRAIGAMTRTGMQAGLRAGTRVLKQATKASAAGRRPAGLLGGKLADKASRRGLVDCVAGMALSAGGARRYYLYKPPGLVLSERLPLLVMLHGCGQDANAFALSTRMNRIAARERFLVLYPEQDRLANPQSCWNWYETRSRRAFGEASIILAAIDQVCLLYPADRERVGIAGMSAGAGMAALLATRYPARFQAVAMHSGVPPGAAGSTAAALRAMRGRHEPAQPEPAPPDTVHAEPVHPDTVHPDTVQPDTVQPDTVQPARPADWPPLLVIHGSRDHVVAASNATAAAQLWASNAGAAAVTARQVQRGARYPMTVTDFKSRGRLAATLCEIEGLGHAWSGGAARERFSDERGPDASRLVWAFMSRRFKAAR